VTAGNINNTTMLRAVLDGLRVHRPGQPGWPRTRPARLLADKGYSSRANRDLLRRRGIPHTIPEPRDQANNRRQRGSQGGRPVGFSAATTATATWWSAASTGSSSGAGWCHPHPQARPQLPGRPAAGVSAALGPQLIQQTR
jgi:hypothetical protein